jgi:hypothetical protein
MDPLLLTSLLDGSYDLLPRHFATRKPPSVPTECSWVDQLYFLKIPTFIRVEFAYNKKQIF